jgi:hypothetical protein
VPDPDGMAQLLHTKLGVHTHPNWRQAFEHHAYIAHFLRVHKSLAVAPTRIEPQVHLDKPNPGDPFFRAHLESLAAFQGHQRPIQTHSIVMTMSNDNLGVLIEKLQRRRQPFRIAQRTPDMGWDRLWVGLTPEDPQYRPLVDGGLCIEIIPSEPLRLPPETYNNPPPQPKDLKPGENVRVTARGFIVRDLDDTLRRCSANMDLEPAGLVQDLRKDGYRRAKIAFNIRHSATLDVVEPTRWDSDVGLYLHNWGPGPHYIRIAANGLEAKAAQLEEKGVKFKWVRESEALDGRDVLRIDPNELEGQVFEYEDYQR